MHIYTLYIIYISAQTHLQLQMHANTILVKSPIQTVTFISYLTAMWCVTKFCDMTWLLNDNKQVTGLVTLYNC